MKMFYNLGAWAFARRNISEEKFISCTRGMEAAANASVMCMCSVVQPYFPGSPVRHQAPPCPLYTQPSARHELSIGVLNV